MVGNVGSEVVDLVIRSMSNALSISISKHHLHSKVKVVTVAKVEFNLVDIIMESFSILISESLSLHAFFYYFL